LSLGSKLPEPMSAFSTHAHIYSGMSVVMGMCLRSYVLWVSHPSGFSSHGYTLFPMLSAGLELYTPFTVIPV